MKIKIKKGCKIKLQKPKQEKKYLTNEEYDLRLWQVEDVLFMNNLANENLRNGGF